MDGYDWSSHWSAQPPFVLAEALALFVSQPLHGSISRRLRFCITKMASAEAACYTVVTEDSSETPSTSDLRSALQKGSDEVKLDTLRKIIVSTINGNHQVRCNMYAGMISG